MNTSGNPSSHVQRASNAVATLGEEYRQRPVVGDRVRVNLGEDEYVGKMTGYSPAGNPIVLLDGRIVGFNQDGSAQTEPLNRRDTRGYAWDHVRKI